MVRTAEVQIHPRSQPLPGGTEHGGREIQTGYVKACFPEHFQKQPRAASYLEQPLPAPGPGGYQIVQQPFFTLQSERARGSAKPGLVAFHGLLIEFFRLHKYS